MKVTKTSRELTKMETYRLTKAPDSQTVQNHVGGTFAVDAWCLYEDTNSRGEELEILSILTTDGEVFNTISETFKRSFLEVMEIFEGEEVNVEVISGTTKAGRTYLDCVAR